MNDKKMVKKRKLDEKLEKIIVEFKRGLIKLYGDKLVDVLLFGSYARGEEKEYSDIDLAIILRGEISQFKEIDRITNFSYDISLKYSILLSIHPISENDFKIRSFPFILNLKEEGVSI